MLRGVRRALGMVIVLAMAAGDARAQFYPGYGQFGWGGWGGGGTVQGDIARGLGMFDAGLGAGREETAIANSINANSIGQWNEFMFLAQQEANRREYLRTLRREQRDAQSGDAVLKRVRDNPTDRDIANGDALNAILDQLTDPRIHSSALRLAKATIPGKAIREIPFENASEAVTISLDQMTGEEGWPPSLQGPTFAAERQAYRDAITKAVKEDEEGDLSNQTLQEVYQAAAKLRGKLEANRPADRAQYLEAVNYIKALYGMSRMLQKPNVDKVLAELDKVKETSLGSLLGFMHTYNLRFGPARTDAQRTVYENLYPVMDEARDRILKEAGGDQGDNRPLARDTKGRPTDFFQGMHLEHLEPRSENDANRP